MSDKNRLFILIEFYQDKIHYDFTNDLELMIQSRKGANDTLITMDNFSDAITVHQIQNLVKQHDDITVINFYKAEVETLGASMGLINAAFKQKARFFSNYESKALKPIMTSTKGLYFENPAHLEEQLFDGELI
ncbi:MAG: hypothetical protein JXR10_15820 [Cyclobacteriaceae bacterium]